MSLFKAREWWSTSCAADEEFDKGCLCISNIDNSTDGSVKIIVGSYSGFLRIYKPQPTKQENGAYSGFRADELLLEAQLSAPILQIQTGILVSSTKSVQLAVLHPFKLSVYTISAVLGTVEHGTYYNLSLIYEHILQRHAFSLILGPFGGIQGKDLICVQSLDGTLNFYEQESFTFSRFLPNSLLPGPIAYVQKSDSFVTVSGFSVESYKFQVLAVAKDDNTDENEINKTFRGKKVAIDWSYNMGEGGIDILIINEQNPPNSLILVLGEKTLFALSPSGTLKFAKKFNFTPSCVMAHNDGSDGSLIICIATTNQTLLVYNEKQLKWAAQLSFRPVCLQRANFMDIKGLIVMLSSQGNLSCCYLGTEPSLFVSPMIEPKEVNFEEAEKEMQELRNTIKTSNQNLLGTQHLGNEISLTINMPFHADNVNVNNEEEPSKTFGLKPSVTVKIHLKCSTVVHDVRLMIHVDPPLKVSQNIFTFGSVVDYSQASVTVMFDSTFIPSSLKFIALAAYTSSQGTPRIFESSALMPFTLVAKACPPSKNADYKITIDMNKKVIPASEIFSDLYPDSSSVVGGAMGIEYFGGQQVAIVPSKSSQRYRLQSDVFPALWLILSEIIRRVKSKYKKDDEHVKFTYTSPLPLQEVFAVIEDHFDIRQQTNEFETVAGQRAEQFRVVQKRLLTKMKDKTPTPLNNLDTLLEATHRHILTLTETLTQLKQSLENSSCQLSCSIQLLLLLLKLSVEMKEEDYTFITACFSPYIDTETSQGWEERLNVALTYVLKFCLGKVGSDLGLQDSSLEMPKDLSKLRKHLTYLFDQITKNVPININGSMNENTKNGRMSDEDTLEQHLKEELVIPVGSKFADNKENKCEEQFIETNDESPTDDSTTTVPPDNSNMDDGFSDYPDDGEEMII